MTQGSAWSDIWSLTKESTANAAKNDKVQRALGASKDASIKAAKSTGKGLDKTRKVVTLEEEWAEAEKVIAELTELARVHHALIASLLERVPELEATFSTRMPDESSV